MLELVAGLTVVFAGYVLYEVFKTVSQTNNQTPVAGPPAAPPKPPSGVKAEAAAPVPQQPAPEAAAKVKAEPAPVKAQVKQEPAPEVPPTVSPEPVNDKAVTTLRNPETGETCAVPTNYRFAKKWIKDALVAERLLDKVYKNTDLDEKGAQKVKDALERLKAIEKYQG
jgi:hypothetical protein